MELSQKTIVVTGAARGIGLALTKALLDEGGRVVMSDVDATALRAAAAGMEGDVLPVEGDVACGAAVQALAAAAEAWAGPKGVAIWINNAGLARHRWISDYSEADIDLMLDVNLKGTILGSQAALRLMKPRKRGHILNVISTASLRGIPGETVYCAATWGVRGFTQGLGEEAAPLGIRVTALLPGGVATGFWAAAAERQAPLEKFLSAKHVADAAVGLLRMDDVCVPRELVLRSLDDRDFTVSP